VTYADVFKLAANLSHTPVITKLAHLCAIQ